ncbi:hypothetical protein EDC94DRAFT_581297 [Helicostylum pulchrum]|nr:hypothetical protein EDC94DRAFT_581297 [Helicostylum pulchrum]
MSSLQRKRFKKKASEMNACYQTDIVQAISTLSTDSAIDPLSTYKNFGSKTARLVKLANSAADRSNNDEALEENLLPEELAINENSSSKSKKNKKSKTRDKVYNSKKKHKKAKK